MTPFDILMNPAVIVASLAFVLMACLEPFTDAWVHSASGRSRNPALQWGWDHFFAPLVRVFMIMILVYLAYPGIFGLVEAPAIRDLLGEDGSRTHSVMSILFVFGLVAPAVPFFHRHSEFVLPLQGIIATGYVFLWLAEYLYITRVWLFPGMDSIVLMLIAAIGGHKLAGVVGKPIGDWLDARFETSGCDIIVVHAVALMTQLPVLLVYGYGLGRQLGP